MKSCFSLLGLALVAQSAAFAAEPKTVEELAVIRDFEVARLDKLSIRSLGDNARFEVGVAWRDPAQRPQGEPATRVVRYFAQCKDKMLALDSVATSDEHGKPVKSYLVPPGSAEFWRPPAGSREAGWIEQACGRN
jgi:hypothetical protein